MAVKFTVLVNTLYIDLVNSFYTTLVNSRMKKLILNNLFIGYWIKLFLYFVLKHRKEEVVLRYLPGHKLAVGYQ